MNTIFYMNPAIELRVVVKSGSKYIGTKNRTTIMLRVGTLESMYELPNDIISIFYSVEPYMSRSFHNTENSIKKILEETIHQCLPDPNSLLEPMPHDRDEYSWKVYLYNLLKENQ